MGSRFDAVIGSGAAVIAGAASGIGLETARVLAARGVPVVLVDCEAAALDEARFALATQFDAQAVMARR